MVFFKKKHINKEAKRAIKELVIISSLKRLALMDKPKPIILSNIFKASSKLSDLKKTNEKFMYKKVIILEINVFILKLKNRDKYDL